MLDVDIHFDVLKDAFDYDFNVVSLKIYPILSSCKKFFRRDNKTVIIAKQFGYLLLKIAVNHKASVQVVKGFGESQNEYRAQVELT